MGANPWRRRIQSIDLLIKALIYRRNLDRDIADELEFHLDMREAKLKASGVRSDEARYAARRLLGNLRAQKNPPVNSGHLSSSNRAGKTCASPRVSCARIRALAR